MIPAKIAKFLIPFFAILSLAPFVSAATALVSGILIAVSLGNPYPTKDYANRLLTWSVVGLGAGMNLATIARVGLQGFGYTALSIFGVFTAGYLLQNLFKVEKEVALLIAVGTAICGGSAIAAVVPVVRAKPHSTSVALATIFILNAVALVVFPLLGHGLAIPERAFGLWSALAIHDTSSVVGATVAYGKIAAEVGTTVKLARALWIVPVALLIGVWHKSTDGAQVAGKAKKPWFILGFLLMAALVTWLPALRPYGHWIEFAAKRVLVLTLFFIGLRLSREALKKVGPRPFILGCTLWILVSVTTLALVETGWIR